jgi:hypothetical protein
MICVSSVTWWVCDQIAQMKPNKINFNIKLMQNFGLLSQAQNNEYYYKIDTKCSATLRIIKKLLQTNIRPILDKMPNLVTLHIRMVQVRNKWESRGQLKSSLNVRHIFITETLEQNVIHLFHCIRRIGPCCHRVFNARACLTG